MAWWKGPTTIMPLPRSLAIVYTTLTKVLLTITLRPFMGQLAGSLAHGVRPRDPCLQDEPTLQKMADFEGGTPRAVA